MFEPVRGGTRGGQAEFKWSDVSADKDRENYLGHSINAPTGRWQKNKDVHWYNRELAQTETERQAEIRKIKEAEEDALAAALGFAPAVRNNGAEKVSGSPAGPSVSPQAKPPDDMAQQLAKAEKKRLKLEKKTRKAERKAMKARKGAPALSDDSDGQRHDHGRYGRSRSRSRSPRRRRSRDDFPDDIRYRRSPLPRRRSRSPPPRNDHRGAAVYDDYERERDRDRDRRRWEENARRDLPAGRRESRY